jgi:hypothetical protein
MTGLDCNILVHLAVVLHTAGVRPLLTSNPGDFRVFGILEIVSP